MARVVTGNQEMFRIAQALIRDSEHYGRLPGTVPTSQLKDLAERANLRTNAQIGERFRKVFKSHAYRFAVLASS
jgi:hypothetical protein